MKTYKLNLNKFAIFLGKCIYVLVACALWIYVTVGILLGLAGM